MEQELQVVKEPTNEIGVPQRRPKAELEAAQEAASAIRDILMKKKNPVIFKGEQYLEFEDWQTIGRFYGLTVRVVSTNPIDLGETTGWEAHAEVIRASDGAVISAADSMCMNDESNWKDKPMFQIRSMAQTRACAKGFRNVLAWVAVMAGFQATPAEEYADGQRRRSKKEKPLKAEDIPDDQLGNWILPFGKFNGRTLSSIMQEVSKSGKATGRDYLEWAVENGKDPEIREILSRYLAIVTQEPSIQV